MASFNRDTELGREVEFRRFVTEKEKKERVGSERLVVIAE